MNLASPTPLHDSLSTDAVQFFEQANFLVVKLTDYCNLRCKYCHQDALNGKPVLIPMETYKNAVRMILKPSKAPKVFVQFHGGEPLLCSDEFFKEAVAFAKAELETVDRRVGFYIQTNLTRVTPERERTLRELDITISYSLDGPPEISDELRGGGRKIVENWRRMKANGTDAGTICLIQPSNWDRMDEVLKFFHDEGIHNVRFNLMVPDGRGKEVNTASTDKLFNAKKTVLDYMLETKGQSVVDATLYNAMKRFVKANGAPSSFEYHGCESLYCQAGRSLYSVNPDGKFYACDRIAENPLWAMGNVNHLFSPPEREFALKKRQAFHHKDDWWARCEGCDAKKICEFSCSAYYVDQVDTRDIECEYTKKMWDYFLERKEDIIAFMKRGVSTVFIDEKKPLEEQPEDTWIIRDVANDAAYNHLSLVETLAANQRYQLFERGGQYYIYLFKRDKIFEVDGVVAEIAKLNGVLGPHLIEAALGNQFPKGSLGQTLENIAQTIPEILAPMTKASEKKVLEHAGHDHPDGHQDDRAGFFEKLFARRQSTKIERVESLNTKTGG